MCPKCPKHSGCSKPHVWHNYFYPGSPDSFIERPNLFDSAPFSIVFGKLSYNLSDVIFKTDILIKF